MLEREGTELLTARVVFVAIDLLRPPVLLTVDLLLFLCRQFAAVGRAVFGHFPVDSGLVALQMRGFARGQLSALDALRDAVLLVQGALADFALGIRILDCGIVLILIDLLRQLILLLLSAWLCRPP